MDAQALPDDYYFPTEAGVLTGLGTMAVMDAMRHGQLRYVIWCGRYVVPKGALLEWLTSLEGRGEHGSSVG